MDKMTKERIETVLPILNEKQKRIFLAAEAKALGYGGIVDVSRVSGISAVTITQGMKEIREKSLDILQMDRCRKKGGGRRKLNHALS